MDRNQIKKEIKRLEEFGDTLRASAKTAEREAIEYAKKNKEAQIRMNDLQTTVNVVEFSIVDLTKRLNW